MKYLLLSFLVSGALSYDSAQSQDRFINEKFTYNLTYLGVPTADAYISVAETLLADGRKAIHLGVLARTTSIFSSIYKLENYYQTYIDSATGLPFRYIKDIQQSTVEQHGEVSYDQSGGMAVFTGGRFKSKVVSSIQQNSHNLFSYVFFLRRQRLSENWKCESNLDVESEPWKIKAEVVSKELVPAAGKMMEAYKVSIRFVPVKKERKRKNTDILTRRVATSQTRVYFWIGVDSPFPVLRIENEMSIFNSYINLVDH